MNSSNLPAQVKKVLQVKYSAPPFSKLSETEQHAHALALLVKITVVTGWPVPEIKEERNILAEQLKLYLIENWALYNVDEIMYAMRSYATVLNNWGKNMNLSLIGKAMTDYEAEREDISKLEESKQPKTENLLPMAADWKPLCEMYYQDYLKNNFRISIMPVELYDEFVRCEMMAEDAYEDWINLSKTVLLHSLAEQSVFDMSANERHELNESTRKIDNGEDQYKVNDFAKKLAVEFLYKTAKKMKKQNLFIQTK